MGEILIVDCDSRSRLDLTDVVGALLPEYTVYSVEIICNAYQILVRNSIDIFFISLDPEGDINQSEGIMLARDIRSIPKYTNSIIVFTTICSNIPDNIRENLNIYDYILKPIIPDEVKQVVERMLPIVNYLNIPKRNQESNLLLFRNKFEVRFIFDDDIILIEAHSKKSTIYYRNGEFETTTNSVKSALYNTNNKCFIKCNRSDFVNIKQIEQINTKDKCIMLKNLDRRVFYTKREIEMLADRGVFC